MDYTDLLEQRKIMATELAKLRDDEMRLRLIIHRKQSYFNELQAKIHDHQAQEILAKKASEAKKVKETKFSSRDIENVIYAEFGQEAVETAKTTLGPNWATILFNLITLKEEKW